MKLSVAHGNLPLPTIQLEFCADVSPKETILKLAKYGCYALCFQFLVSLWPKTNAKINIWQY